MSDKIEEIKEKIKDSIVSKEDVVCVLDCRLQSSIDALSKDIDKADNGKNAIILEEVEAESPLSAFFLKDMALEEISHMFFDRHVDHDTTLVEKIKKWFPKWNKIDSGKSKGAYLFFTYENIAPLEVSGIAYSQKNERKTISFVMDGRKCSLNASINFGIVLA